jgi:hypothetical protein
MNQSIVLRCNFMCCAAFIFSTFHPIHILSLMSHLHTPLACFFPSTHLRTSYTTPSISTHLRTQENGMYKDKSIKEIATVVNSQLYGKHSGWAQFATGNCLFLVVICSSLIALLSVSRLSAFALSLLCYRSIVGLFSPSYRPSVAL